MSDVLDSPDYSSRQKTGDVDSRQGSTLDENTESSEAREVCSNCGAARTGTYCASCGQKFHERPLTVRRLVRDVVERVFDLDQGLLHTFWQLVIHPGTVARRYVEGLRKPYVNPIAYLVICVAVTIVGMDLLGERLVDVMYWPYVKDGATMPGDFDIVAFWEEVLKPGLTYLTLFMAIPITLAIYIFYRKSHEYTFVETLIPVVYGSVQASFYACIVYPVMLLVPPMVGFVIGQTSLIIVVLVIGQTMYGFYDRTLKDFVLGCLGSMVGLFVATFGIGLVFGIAAFVRATSGI